MVRKQANILEAEQKANNIVADVEVLCELEANLSDADERKFVLKNRHFWNRGKKYYKVDFIVKVFLGPADLRFELCKLVSA